MHCECRNSLVADDDDIPNASINNASTGGPQRATCVADQFGELVVLLQAAMGGYVSFGIEGHRLHAGLLGGPDSSRSRPTYAARTASIPAAARAWGKRSIAAVPRDKSRAEWTLRKRLLKPSRDKHDDTWSVVNGVRPGCPSGYPAAQAGVVPSGRRGMGGAAVPIGGTVPDRPLPPPPSGWRIARPR